MSAAGSWIVESGSATPGTGGGTPLPSAPPVTIVSATPTARSDGTWEIVVVYTANAAATTLNYTGVHVYLEDPDISALPNAPLDGTTPLDGSTQLSGKWSPKLVTDSSKSPVTILADGDTADRVVRIYLLAYGPHTNSALVRANLPSPTPSITVTIPAEAAVYVSGQEHAWQVTNPKVIVNPFFDDPANASYTLTFSYTAPDPSIPLPPGMEQFGGVNIWFAYLNSDGNIIQAGPTGIDIDVLSASGYDSGKFQPGLGTSTFLAFFVSRGVDGQVNTMVPGVTPFFPITITYPPLGQGVAPSVGPLNLGPSSYAPQPDGSVYEQATLSWTLPPTNPRYGGVNFYVTSINGVPQTHPQLIAAADNHTTQVVLSTNQYPAVAGTWTITAISVGDKNVLADDPANPQSYSPSVVWNVGPPGAPGGAGNEVAPLVDLSTMAPVVTDQQLSNDGVQMMRFTFTGWKDPLASDPRVNSFGGVKIGMQDSNGIVYFDSGKATSFTTPWLPAAPPQTIKFFWVSYNPQNVSNTLLPGTTPEKDVPFTPNPGQIVPTRDPGYIWWSNEFVWPSGGAFSAQSFNAVKINVGQQLIVGGAPNSFGNGSGGTMQDGQIAVLSGATGLPVGWIGTQQAGQGIVGQPKYGAWFGQLWVGGKDPGTSPIWINNSGLVIVGGIAYQNGSPPFILIEDQTGLTLGKIGAQLNLKVDGSTISGAPAIGGAWFSSLAIGGPDISQWNVLSNYNSSTGVTNVQMKNVNLFQITWQLNQSGQLNYPTQLTFGQDAYLTNYISGYAFPGLALYDTSGPGQNFGAVLINRGLILYGYQGNRRAVLVTYNGTQSGSNINNPQNFWAELDLYGPADVTAATPTVQLTSGWLSGGVPVGDSSFTMRDSNLNTTFNVDHAGNVTARAGLWVGTVGAKQVVDGAGNWVGNPIASGANVSSLNGLTGAVTINSNGSLVVTPASPNVTIGINQNLINSSGVFVSVGGVNVGSAAVAGGAFTASSLSVSGTASLGPTSVNGGDLTITGANHLLVPAGSVGAGVYYVYTGGTYVQGTSGTFTSANGKTVTVIAGLITSIV